MVLEESVELEANTGYDDGSVECEVVRTVCVPRFMPKVAFQKKTTDRSISAEHLRANRFISNKQTKFRHASVKQQVRGSIEAWQQETQNPQVLPDAPAIPYTSVDPSLERGEDNESKLEK